MIPSPPRLFAPTVDGAIRPRRFPASTATCSAGRPQNEWGGRRSGLPGLPPSCALWQLLLWAGGARALRVGWRTCLNNWASSRDPLDTPRCKSSSAPRCASPSCHLVTVASTGRPPQQTPWESSQLPANPTGLYPWHHSPFFHQAGTTDGATTSWPAASGRAAAARG